MAVRLLHLSDVHLDAPFTWASTATGPAGAAARRQAIRDVLADAVTLARSRNVDGLTIGGDLYEHERSSADTGRFLADLFAGAGMPVLLAPGNHDWYGPSSLYARTAWPSNVHIFTAPELTPHSLGDGATVWGAAHCHHALTPGFLTPQFRVDRGGINVGLFHGSERGAFHAEGPEKKLHAPFTGDQVPAAGLHHALLGHFHMPSDAPHHTYPGNPEPLTFGEDGQRAAVEVTVHDDGTVDRHRHVVARTRVTDMTVDVTGAEHSDAVRQVLLDALGGAGGVVRVTVTGELPAGLDVPVGSLPRTAAGVDAVIWRVGDIRIAHDLDAIAAQATVAGEFVRQVRAAGLDEDTTRRVLTTGLRALSGSTDLAVS